MPADAPVEDDDEMPTNLSLVLFANSRSCCSLLGSANSSHTARALSRTTVSIKILRHTSLASILSVFGVGKVLQCSYLKEVIFDLLYAPRSTVFDQVLHGVQCLVDAPPLLGARAQPLP